MTALLGNTFMRPALAFAAALLASAGFARAASGERPIVVTTNTILADMARTVAGETVEVRCLVAAGIELHGFEPRPADVAGLSRAAIVIANGLGFEPWLHELVVTSGFSGRVIQASDGCALIERTVVAERAAARTDAANSARFDPHAWQDPANGVRYIENISAALVQAVPASAAEIRRRTRLYTAQLETLDSWARRLFAEIPPARRRFIASHDSLAYLGRAYGLEILPLRGIDPRQEPDARQVAALVDTLRAQKVRALFVEAVSNPKMLEQLARDTGAVVGGELFTDSVAPPGNAADSYLGLLRENTLRLVAALGSG